MQLSSLELVLPETWTVNFSIAELDRCAELPSYEDKLKFFFENQGDPSYFSGLLWRSSFTAPCNGLPS